MSARFLLGLLCVLVSEPIKVKGGLPLYLLTDKEKKELTKIPAAVKCLLAGPNAWIVGQLGIPSAFTLHIYSILCISPTKRRTSTLSTRQTGREPVSRSCTPTIGPSLVYRGALLLALQWSRDLVQGIILTPRTQHARPSCTLLDTT